MKNSIVRVLLVLLVALISLALSTTATANLNREDLNHALVSTVLILTLDDDEEVVASGSGSIVDPRGVILTNFHVVGDPDTGELSHSEGVVGIAMTRNPRQPAVAMFYGQVVDANPELDLALVKVIADLDGNAPEECLQLPYYEIGDSDAIQIGDDLSIVGFPGIGGSSVTLTSGRVSGFESTENGVTAWIKTDAEINPGNSGGSAVADDGTLVGIPTQVVSDITTGSGQIGRLRPINFAADRLSDLSDIELPGCEDGSSPPPAQSGTQKRVSGVILSADSGEPIRNAIMVILTPGITWDTADLDNEDHIYEVARTDSRGNFETEQTVDLSTPYSIGFAAEGYMELANDNILFEDFDTGAATVELEVSLKSQ